MIRLQHLYKSYPVKGAEVPALTDINLAIEPGEIFGIIGHSGAGKSTLVRCINLLERPTEGQVIIGGTDLTTLSERDLQASRRKIGMIFQHFNLLSSATVADNIAFPLRLAKRKKAEIDRRVNELIQLVGLEEHRHKHPAQLSGGQKQRVGIARALAADPQVLLCDEATSALDPQTTASILALLRDINRRFGLTIVLITHEMHVIRSVCDRLAVIQEGRIVESGPVLEVFLKPQHRATREFIEQVEESAELREAISREKAAGKRNIVRLTFIGEKTYEPVLYETMRETGTSFAILQGTISRMKDTPYGQLVVNLDGTPEQTRDTVRLLQSRGVEVEAL